MNIYSTLTALLLLSSAFLPFTEAGKKGRKGRQGVKGRGTKPEKFEICSDSEDTAVMEEHVTSQGDVEDALNATKFLLKTAVHSLTVLVNKKSFNGTHNIFSSKVFQELNPTEEIKLASDEKFKFLGQMTWWLNWIEASLMVLQRISSRVHNPQVIVPAITEYNTNHINVSSATTDVHKLRRSLSILRSKVGYTEKKVNCQKGKSAVNCQKVQSAVDCQKVQFKLICSRKIADCSLERDRAYVILRNVLRALKRMENTLENCAVSENPEGTGFWLGECHSQPIFYLQKCLKHACDFQERCKKCLVWGYVEHL